MKRKIENYQVKEFAAQSIRSCSEQNQSADCDSQKKPRVHVEFPKWWSSFQASKVKSEKLEHEIKPRIES
jgi:hypothetical protein